MTEVTSRDTQVLDAAQRTLHVVGAKPKDTTVVLDRLKSEFNIDATMSGGLLKLTQASESGETVMDTGLALANYIKKFPLDFHGENPEPGSINFKSDVIGIAAKSAFIEERGLTAWERLPASATSPGAAHVLNNAIPRPEMNRTDYLRLTVSEKTKLAAEIGPAGIGAILTRRK